MITLALQAKSRTEALYLVEYKGRIYQVSVPVKRMKHRVIEYRHAINKALRLNTTDYRFIGNKRIGNQWIQEWKMNKR